MQDNDDEKLKARLQQDKQLQFFHEHEELKAVLPENKKLKEQINNELDIDNCITISRCVLVFLSVVILCVVNSVTAKFSIIGNLVGLLFLFLAAFAPKKFHIGFGGIIYIIGNIFFT